MLLQDFAYALSPENPAFVPTLVSVLLTFFLGFMVYVYSLLLVIREKSAPYPVWLHTFYCAADFMGIWVFLDAWKNYDHFPLFLILSVGEAIWVCMELYSLQRALTYEKDIIWKPGTSFKSHLTDIIIQVVCFFTGLNMLRFELHDETMWKFWIFTQVLVTTVPVWELRKRGYKSGNWTNSHA